MTLKYKTTAEIKVAKNTVDQIIGQEEAVKTIKKAALQRRNVLLIGEPGTGKSLTGQALAELLPDSDLVDIISLPNQTDENNPLIKTMPKGQGKELVTKAKMQVMGSLKNQNIFFFVLVILAMIAPWWARKLYGDIIAAATIISSMIFLATFILFMNLNRKAKMNANVPKLLVDNGEKKKAPFIDACLLPGQKVFTNPIPIKIEETIGKTVYNADGKKQKVVNVERKYWEGKVYHIKPRLLFPFTATQNHPFLILERPDIKQFKNREFRRRSSNINNYLKWKKAEELKKGDMLIYPELTHPTKYQKLMVEDKQNKIPKKIVVDYELAEIFGWYLAEGYARIVPKRRKYYIGFTLGYTEMNEIKRLKDLIQKKFNLVASIDTHTKHSIELLIYSKTLALLFKELFSSGAKNKQIPRIIFESPREVKLKFLEAYIQGDGHETKNSLSVATTSKNIAEDLVFLFSSLGIFPTCYHRKMKDSEIKGRKIKSPYIYEFNITGKQQARLGRNQGHFQHYFSKDNLHFIPIKKIEAKPYKGEIVNMETEDGTYLMPCITHNTGAHAGALLGDCLHDPLQSLSSSNKITSVVKVGKHQTQIMEAPVTFIDQLLEENKKEIIKKEDYEAVFLPEKKMVVMGEKNKEVESVDVLSVNRYQNKNKYLIKVQSESGKEILVSPEHKVAIMKFGKVVYKEARNLTRFDKILTLDS